MCVSVRENLGYRFSDLAPAPVYFPWLFNFLIGSRNTDNTLTLAHTLSECEIQWAVICEGGCVWGVRLCLFLLVLVISLSRAVTFPASASFFCLYQQLINACSVCFVEMTQSYSSLNRVIAQFLCREGVRFPPWKEPFMSVGLVMKWRGRERSWILRQPFVVHLLHVFVILQWNVNMIAELRRLF